MENIKYVSLNRKIFMYSLLITTATLLIINYLTVFLVNNSIDMEKELILEDMTRVFNAIDDSIEDMNGHNIEYSSWDLTKDYIIGDYPQFIEENFMDETFASNSWNTIIIYSLDKMPIYQKGYDLYADKEIPVPSALLNYLQNASLFEQIKDKQDYVSGIITLNNKAMIITIFPILSSYQEGPVSGYFVTGRYLDKTYIDEISRLNQYNLELANDVQINSEKIIGSSNIKEAYIWSSILNNDITGYIALPDLNQQAKIVLNYTRFMNHLHSSKNTINLYVIIIILIIIFNFIGILFLINRMFVKRLNIFLDHMSMIIEDKDLSKRMENGSNDEFSILNNRFNHMLDEIEALNNQLLNKARIDQLTDLPNRHYFYELVDDEIRNNLELKAAVFFLDLDKFKEVNDTYGHNVGDEFLKEFAIKLQKVLKKEDKVCRLGGDEFAIWTHYNGNRQAIEIYVEELIKVLKNPILIFDHKLSTVPSIGISLYPENGLDIEMLIDNADYAMYQAKNNQKNYAFYREIKIGEALKNDAEN